MLDLAQGHPFLLSQYFRTSVFIRFVSFSMSRLELTAGDIKEQSFHDLGHVHVQSKLPHPPKYKHGKLWNFHSSSDNILICSDQGISRTNKTERFVRGPPPKLLFLRYRGWQKSEYRISNKMSVRVFACCHMRMWRVSTTVSAWPRSAGLASAWQISRG